MKREHYKSEGIPVLKIQNIKPFEISLKNIDYVNEAKAKELKRHAYQKGDIIITKFGLPLGISAIVEDIVDGIIVADLVRVRAGKVDTKYLCYHLNSPVTNAFLNAQQGGATRPRVRISAVRELPIHVPPLPEQKRIVAILDEAFEGIGRAAANDEKNLANARELFESYLNAVFTQKGEGWVEKPVEDLAMIVSGFSFKSGDFSPKNPAKSIKITNVGVRRFVPASLSNLPADFVKKYSQFLIPEGSIVLALTRTVISNGLKVAVVPKEFDSSLLNQRVAALKVNSDDTLRQYLFYFLCTSSVVDYVKKKANTLMQPNLSINDLKKLAVPIAPSNQRAEIVRKLISLTTETKRLESLYQQKLTALAELKQTLLHKAFTGELTAKPDIVLKHEAVA